MADDPQSKEPIIDDEAREVFLLEASAIEERRRLVMRLRARRLSEGQIARAINMSVATVSRDINWLRDQWRELYGGDTATFDSAAFIGESLSAITEVEAIAWTDAHRAGIPLRDKMTCLALVLAARRDAKSFVQDLGLVERSLGSLTVGLPTAAQIRQALQAARANPKQLEAVNERDDDDE